MTNTWRMKVENEKSQQHQKWLCDDILMDILSRVPARYLVRFRFVSKHWRSLIDNPYFINMHLKNARKHAPSVLIATYQRENAPPELSCHSFSDRVLNPITTMRTGKNPRCPTIPCNGLTCLYGENDIILLNPTTQEHVTFPKLSHMPEDARAWVSLGFLPSENKYMLIWASNGAYSHPVSGAMSRRFHLLTLDGSNTCRQTTEVCYRFCGGKRICVDGVMYYFIAADHESNSPGILSLDLETAKFTNVPLPPRLRSGSLNLFKLHDFHGKLCMTHPVSPQYYTEPLMHTWILDDPAKGLWIKKCTVYPNVLLYEVTPQFVALFNGFALFWHLGGLNCCVLDKEESFEPLKNENINLYSLVYTYMETLVPVKSLV